jgi:putative DNA primase/helicase
MEMEDAHPRVVMNPMTHYKSEEIRWLEDGLIAMGKLTLVAGDPGLGKSFMTLELACRVSRGEIGRRDNGLCGRTVILSAEDSASDTLLPRLKAMCARLSHVHFFEGMRSLDGEHVDLPQLDRDTDLLVDAIVGLGDVSLIVIDPISAYMGRADSHNNAEVRSVLAKLARLGEITGAAVVCVTHLNKDSSGKRAVYRAMGSLAFTAAARTVLLVTKHPKRDDDPHGDRKRVVSMVKNNLGPIAPGRVFIIDDGMFVWLDDEVTLDADALDALEPDARPSQRDRAGEFLDEILAQGEQPAGEILERGRERGLNHKTLKRAKQAMKIVSLKRGTVWYWSRDALEHEDDAPLIRQALEVTIDEPPFGQFGTY